MWYSSLKANKDTHVQKLMPISRSLHPLRWCWGASKSCVGSWRPFTKSSATLLNKQTPRQKQNGGTETKKRRVNVERLQTGWVYNCDTCLVYCRWKKRKKFTWRKKKRSNLHEQKTQQKKWDADKTTEFTLKPSVRLCVRKGRADRGRETERKTDTSLLLWRLSDWANLRGLRPKTLLFRSWYFGWCWFNKSLFHTVLSVLRHSGHFELPTMRD